MRHLEVSSKPSLTVDTRILFRIRSATPGFQPLPLPSHPLASEEALQRGPETRPAGQDKHQYKEGTWGRDWENLCWRRGDCSLCSRSPWRRSLWQQDAPSTAPGRGRGGAWAPVLSQRSERRGPRVFRGSRSSPTCVSLNNTHTSTSTTTPSPFRWPGQSLKYPRGTIQSMQLPPSNLTRVWMEGAAEGQLPFRRTEVAAFGEPSRFLPSAESVSGLHTVGKLIFLSYCFHHFLPCSKALRALLLSPAEPHKLLSSILGAICALWCLRCCPPAQALGDFRILIPAYQLLPDAISLLNPTVPCSLLC